MMDVLVFTPVYRLEPETIEALFALQWKGPLSYLLQRDNPMAAAEGQALARHEAVANTLHQYRRGRRAFLQGDYDAMLVIESDVIPPPFALQRLAALDVDVAYGCYLFRNTPVLNVFERYAPNGDGQPALNVGESLSLHPAKLAAAVHAGAVDCSGGGLGCVLIKRHVLEAIDFRTLETLTPRNHCDTWFTADVYKAGYSMRAEMTVLCGHKREDGEILWPSWKS